jgi:hypothetical protein
MYYKAWLWFITITVSGARDEYSAVRIGAGSVDATFIKE